MKKKNTRSERAVFPDPKDERAVRLARYIISNNSTVRGAAKAFSVSKSTVHKDMTERLCECDRQLFLDVAKILQKNKAERHLRGGFATKEKYSKLK